MSIVNEQIVTGRKFRKLIDEASRLWLRISFWTKACDVEFDDGETAETKFSNMLKTINDLKQSFQDGVDKIYNYLKGLGFTPADKSPDGICATIKNMYDKRYDDGRAQGRADVVENPSDYGVIINNCFYDARDGGPWNYTAEKAGTLYISANSTWTNHHPGHEATTIHMMLYKNGKCYVDLSWKDIGYTNEAEEGILNIAYNLSVDVGDTITISHKENGVYATSLHVTYSYK